MAAYAPVTERHLVDSRMAPPDHHHPSQQAHHAVHAAPYGGSTSITPSHYAGGASIHLDSQIGLQNGAPLPPLRDTSGPYGMPSYHAPTAPSQALPPHSHAPQSAATSRRADVVPSASSSGGSRKQARPKQPGGATTSSRPKYDEAGPSTGGNTKHSSNHTGSSSNPSRSRPSGGAGGGAKGAGGRSTLTKADKAKDRAKEKQLELLAIQQAEAAAAAAAAQNPQESKKDKKRREVIDRIHRVHWDTVDNRDILYQDLYMAMQSTYNSLLLSPSHSRPYVLAQARLVLERDAELRQTALLAAHQREGARKAYEHERNKVEEEARAAKRTVRDRLMAAVEERRRKLKEEKEGGEVAVDSLIDPSSRPHATRKLRNKQSARARGADMLTSALVGGVGLSGDGSDLVGEPGAGSLNGVHRGSAADSLLHGDGALGGKLNVALALDGATGAGSGAVGGDLLLPADLVKAGGLGMAAAAAAAAASSSGPYGLVSATTLSLVADLGLASGALAFQGSTNGAPSAEGAAGAGTVTATNLGPAPGLDTGMGDSSYMRGALGSASGTGQAGGGTTVSSSKRKKGLDGEDGQEERTRAAFPTGINLAGLVAGNQPALRWEVGKSLGGLTSARDLEIEGDLINIRKTNGKRRRRG